MVGFFQAYNGQQEPITGIIGEIPGNVSGALPGNNLIDETGIATPHYVSDYLYASLQLFVLQSGAQVPVKNLWLEFARFMAPVLTLSSLLIIFWTLFDGIRIIKLYFNPRHVVVCGSGYLGPAIARHYLKKENRFVVIIEKDPGNPVLDELRQEKRAMIINGDATQERLLRQARIFCASEIFLVTGNDDVNAEISVLCEKIVEEYRNREDQKLAEEHIPDLPLIYTKRANPRCHVHIEDALLSRTLRITHPPLDDGKSPVKMEFFNIYSIAGYCVQKSDHPPFTEPEIRYGMRPHLMVIGFGRMGENFVVQVAKRWKARGKKEPLPITVIGKNARQRVAELRIWYPSLDKYCAISAIDKDAGSLGLLEIQDIFSALIKPVSRIYICLDNSSRGVSIALVLLDKIRFGQPVFVRSLYERGVTHVLQSFRSNGALENLYPFPIISSPCCMDYITGGIRDTMARFIHEAYRDIVREELRQECRIEGTIKTDAEKFRNYIENDEVTTDPEKDPALRSWHELDENRKEYNRCQVDDIRRKLNEIGYALQPLTWWDEDRVALSSTDIEQLAREYHESWMRMKKNDGYTYGKDRSESEKTSPFLVQFNQLPEKKKERNRKLVGMFPSLLALADIQIIEKNTLLEKDNIIQLIAEAIHDEYRNDRLNTPGTDPHDLSLNVWDELDTSLRNSNIDQARDIINKLDRIDCEVTRISLKGDKEFVFSPDEIEFLAYLEHERWMKERTRAGWVYGSEKNVAGKISPYLIEYDRLPDDVKEYDRKAIRNIPSLLKKIGYQVARKHFGYTADKSNNCMPDEK